MKGSCGFREVEHTADWSLYVWGSTFCQLCACAAEGMLWLAGAVPATREEAWRSIALQADDREALLVVWLEELLFALEMEQVTFTDFELAQSSELELHGRVRTAPIDRLDKPIKAVTFHELAIDETERGFETFVVFDV